MARAGKRWRPFLAACTYEAFRSESPHVSEDDLQRTAVAVECFHKASLIHDDIEDGDVTRYDAKTLHAEYGVPIALNVGDFLLGEGYRLLTEVNVPEAQKVNLLRIAARGHRSLCLGQGRELAWMRTPGPLAVPDVLDIFRMKTAPAFEVALRLGAILAGCDEQVHEALRRYSESLGIAYQIRDDLDDLRSPRKDELLDGTRPSVLLALAQEKAAEAGGERREAGGRPPACGRQPAAFPPDVEAAAWRLMEAHKAQAIGSLMALKNAGLKGLLRRVIGKIFNDFDVMGCCNDPGAGHAPDRGQ